MSVMRAVQLLLAFASAITLLGGCSRVAGPSSTSFASVSPPTTQPSGDATSALPSDPAPFDSSPAETAGSVLGSDVPFSPDTTLTPPPDGLLAVDGGDPVVGELGTWTWRNAGSDAPWLPGYAIHVGAAEQLRFAMTKRVPIESWTVSRVPPSSVPGSDGVVGMGDGTTGVITVAAPPVGTWSVSVHVRFADNLGDATYYWAVTVD